MIGPLKVSEIDDLLRSETVGRLGCAASGRVYVVPITFLYEDGFIYGHSRMGEKIQMMRANPSVCFEVDRVINLSNWRSVIAWGTYEELQDAEAIAAMERLLVRLGPTIVGSADLPWHGLSVPLLTLARHVVRHGVVYRIRVKERTGRFEHVP